MAARADSDRRARAWLLALVAATAALAACFSPGKPPCAFTCISASRLCPDDYTCGADGLCHRDGAEDVCGLTAPYGEAGAGGGAAGAGGGVATGALGGATGAGGQGGQGAGGGGAGGA